MDMKKAASVMGRKGGKSRSHAKIKAAQRNGALGGRPKNAVSSKVLARRQDTK